MLPSPPFLLSPFLLLLLFLHHATSFSTSGPHITDVNILLPPKMTHPVEYRLQASDGCFKWSWDHHDILSVLPEFNASSRCSTSARLRSIAPYGGRKETAVYATDLNSGMVIRCKVYVDAISKIKIFHNSVKLDLDGLATLRVRAFDAEDNVFSSLVGLQFMWQLMPETHGLPHSLVHVPLKESPLSDCSGFCGDLDIQVNLEESGVFSDFYVVKGTEIGHEIVSVSLLEPSFGHLADNIVLTVAEAMSLDPPSPVHVLIGAVVHYTLKVIRSNIPHVVSLPSSFHQWSVLNSSVAQVDKAMGTVHAFNLGVTAVAVEDTRVVGHMQISSLHVVLPDSLLLFISPLSSTGGHIEGLEPIPSVSRWYVVAGRLYMILVKVFSPGLGAQEIYITESDEIKLHGNQDEFWNILPLSEGVTAKSNYRMLDAKSYGLGKLTATLAYHTGRDVKKEVLKVVQEVMVCDQIKFIIEGDSSVSDKILLPWVPGVYQELELRASGGCSMSSSDYKWFSSDMSTASVSVSGIVQAKKPGKVTIRAVSIFDSLNYDEVVIEVSVPHSMVLLPNFPVEARVGSHLQASVTLRASTGAYFHACDAFRSFIRWKTESDSFIIVNTTMEVFVTGIKEAVEPHSISYGPPCSWTNIYAASCGRTLLHATLTRDNQLPDHVGRESTVLKASSSIAAFLPLIVHQASDGNQFGGYWFDWVHAESQNQLNSLDYLYLVPGTHLDVLLRGGPERWGKDVEFVENVAVLAEQDGLVKDKIFIRQIPTNYGNPYRIGCDSLGTFRLIFRRGNLMGEDHHLPVVSEVQLLLICSFPSSIVIIADEALNVPLAIQSAARAERLPGRIRASPIKVANGRRIRASAVGLSDSGKPFANSSSIFLSWELAECEGLALLDDTESSAVYSSWERFLILQNTSGLCTVRSTAVSFDSLGHNDFAAKFETSKNTLTDAIQLQLVSSLGVSPEFSLLFFSPEARLNISITGGSCFLDTLVNDTHIVEVIRQIPDYDCSQLTLAPKSVGSALVTVQDVGLVPPLSASSTVQVADMDWIKILTGEHISIEKGSLQSINFLVGVGDGRTFDPSQYIYMKISVNIEEDIVDVVENYDFPLVADRNVRGPTFTLQGTHLGVTTIYLSAIQHSGHEIVSQPIKVEVYNPPRVHPRDIFLVPGASYVLTVRGGPKIGSHVRYSSLDDKKAQIHKFSGRLSAISPGNSTLVATIYGVGDIMLCRAYGIVKVGIPSSAILNVQSEKIAVDLRMPIYPSLSEGNLFSFYELCNNFKWTVGDKDVLDFQGEKNAHGRGNSSLKTSLNELDLNFIQVLHGISAGKTKVAVSFSCSFKNSNSLSKSMFYTASVSISVVPDLPLALGSPITWILPSYYTSSDLLPLSSHAYSKGGSLSDNGIAYSFLGQEKRRIDEVHNDDLYIDGAKIITKDSGNVACILAKDKASGRTEVASCVRVAELDQIRTADEFPVHMVALGADLGLPIRYHDILGNPFQEAHNITLFEVETNYPHVISIDEYDGHGTIHLRAKTEGLALVQVSFVNNPRKAVYAMISVGPQLYPQNPVIHQGASLNFDVKGLGDSASGQWFSSNESVVSVERLSGKAEATGEGTTLVHFTSSSFKLHTTVIVLKGSVVSVDAPSEVLTNVPFPVNGYAFSVKFSDEVSEKKMLLSFDCAVSPPKIGFAKPWKDPDTGNTLCLFFPHSPQHLVRSVSNTGDSPHQVLVSVRASLTEDNQISGSASALFVGGFTLETDEKNSLHLNLTRDSNKSVVTITGNTNVELSWLHRNHLIVRPIHGGDPAVAKYEISARGPARIQDQLVFSLPATGQRVAVSVSYDPDEREAAAKPANLTFWAGISALLFLLIFTVTFVICYLDRPDRSPPRVSFGSPSIVAPATPERSSPAVVKEQSPRTPQPFIDYVRRTIDETPYYRQDFRRRSNPQHTF
ncbi:nuclear pore complex protein GP210 [Salvia miltiorrhiza]|uniref:nuclear pore complex protein GP210 n=1 Tax=Salvia miltiorrhiza TaxID=226208 RepID=UPI0025ABB264|nr:nuclear pore complex protein GP210 [Salvia miltiorrhiza]